MGFLKFLGGKGPEEIERKGDQFFEAGEFGAAKLEYERALDKLSVKTAGDPGPIERLKDKLRGSREALALFHKDTAADLMETGYWEEAQERLELAMDLTEEEGLGQAIQEMFEKIRECVAEETREEFAQVFQEEEDPQAGEIEAGEEEYFAALCSPLPDDERAAYYGYGEAFRKGFVALNQGLFETAAMELSRALEENSEPGSYILLELASALLNLGREDEARDLLEAFLKTRPESLKAYAVLCEILWEKGAFDEALDRLKACPEEGVDPVAHLLLWGETLFQAARYEEAESLFLGFIRSRGWEENVARSLARVYEAAGSTREARSLYLEIMENCQSCRRAVDPQIRRRLADLNFESGILTLQTLESYLALAQEDPANRKEYYRKIGWIYESMGNEKEALRFRAFAERDWEE